jgi:hypothetical protein
LCNRLTNEGALFRRKDYSEKTGNDYDFFSRGDRKRGKTYQAKKDKPDFLASRVKKLEERGSDGICDKNLLKYLTRRLLERRASMDLLFLKKRAGFLGW